MNGKIKDYLIYGALGIVFIFSLYLLFSPGTPTQVIVDDNTGAKDELVLDTPSVSVKVGEETQVSAHVNNNPNAVINYLSVNTDIAVMTNGTTVKGVNVGRTYIMVTYHDNSGADQIKHCSVDVLTNENYVIEKITMADGDIVVKVGDSYKLNYQVTPSGATYKASYLSSDNTIATML